MAPIPASFSLFAEFRPILVDHFAAEISQETNTQTGYHHVFIGLAGLAPLDHSRSWMASYVQ
jgi:hypothetical protein